MKRLSLLIAILFSCCLLLVDTSVVDAKIVFVIDGDIYVMEDDGTKRRRLTKTTDPIYHSYPRWSPDGERIAFVRQMEKRHDSDDLFIMNADGTNVQRLTDYKGYDIDSSWSPDGTRLAFTSTRSGTWQVHVMDLATRDVTQLTGLDGVEGEAAATPDWSPDGRQIVYEKFTDAGKNIYVMSADGTNQRPLLAPKDVEGMQRFFPRWSADGKRIVFNDCAWPEGKPRCRLSIATLGGRIHVVQGIYDKLGDNLRIGNGVWIHNDKSLLLDIVLDESNTSFDIYRYDLNTQTLTRLTDGEESEAYPDWIEGALPVAPKDKKKILWGTLKQVNPNLF